MLLLVGGALWSLRGQVPAVLELARHVRPRWSFVAIATLVGLLTYGALIENWRRVLELMGGRISYGVAATIWLSSSLARYLPGAFWQFGAMTEMTRRRGVPVTVSLGAAVLITLVNLITGYAVFAATSFSSPVLSPSAQLLLVLGGVALLVAPFAAPRLGRLATRLSGREIVVPRFSLRPALVAGVFTAAAWIAYGVAFWALTRALLPGERPVLGCIAVYTASYLVGLVNPAPAGLGAAEAALIWSAPQMGVATAAEAAVLAVAVRVWRTVLDVVPGLIALPYVGAAPDDQASRGSRIP